MKNWMHFKSIKTRLLVLTIGLVTGLAFLLIVFTKTVFRDSLLLELRKRGTFIAENIAVESTDLVLTNDVITLQLKMNEYIQRIEDVEYIVLVDKADKIIAQASKKDAVAGVEKKTKTAFSPSKSKAAKAKSATNTLTITMPIMKGEAGFIKLILSEENTKNSVQKVNSLIIKIVVIGILLSCGLAWLLIGVITQPIAQLTRMAKVIAAGNVEQRVAVRTQDEIGVLAQAFNEIVDYMREMALKSQQIAHGEVDIQISARSAQDVLSNNFKEMIVYLQRMAETAKNISQGNLETTIILASSADCLGLAFQQMTQYFQEMSKLAQEISQGNISGKIRVRSQFDVLGTSFRQIVEYLQEMAVITQEVSRGNLTTAIKPRSAKDLIGNALSSMITGLRDLISQIQESSNQIHSRANEMASLSRTSSEAISQMASNVSQISVSITKISDTTQTVATVAQKAAKTAETGDENISGVIAKVSHSKDNAYQSTELIRNLGKRSMQIGEIINYITKVADQTNLLSLNAAIEAARAGEAGRGFAVVADEVRKLAEGSAQSASEIARLISEVQAETAKAVAAVEVVAKDVSESATVTQDAGKSFKDISQAAKNIAGQIEDIAASSEETAASAQEASASSEEQVATFEEISTSIENLKEIAESLKDSASKFKLS